MTPFLYKTTAQLVFNNFNKVMPGWNWNNSFLTQLCSVSQPSPWRDYQPGWIMANFTVDTLAFEKPTGISGRHEHTHQHTCLMFPPPPPVPLPCYLLSWAGKFLIFIKPKEERRWGWGEIVVEWSFRATISSSPLVTPKKLRNYIYQKNLVLYMIVFQFWESLFLSLKVFAVANTK